MTFGVDQQAWAGWINSAIPGWDAVVRGKRGYEAGCGEQPLKIVLRHWSDDDADWCVRQVRDPEILRSTTERETLTVEGFRRALDEVHRNDDALGFVVIDAATGARLANIVATRHGQLAEVSYWVASAARGKGVASRDRPLGIDLAPGDPLTGAVTPSS